MKWIAVIAFATASAVLSLPDAHAKLRFWHFGNDDEVFLQLRDAAADNQAGKASKLASRLDDYDIPSYVDYFQLKPRVHLAPEREIRDFLMRYQGSAIADRLRNDWLLELGKVRNWELFDEQYPQFVLNDDTQVKCYALMSKALKGKDVAMEARSVLVSPQYYGEGCPALIATLVDRRQFNADDVWAQVRLIAESGTSATMRRIANLTEAPEAALIQALERPDTALAKGVGNGRAGHELFIVALGGSAARNSGKAVRALTAAADRLDEKELAIAWAQIALQASKKLEPEAVTYWQRAAGAPLSNDGYQWRVRAALLAGDWSLVKSGIDNMPLGLKNEHTWIYWMGRALKAEGKQEEAQEKFQSIAVRHDFYGQLALEELDRKIIIPPRAAPPTPEEIAPMAENQGFRRALRFFEMNMRFEAYREWNWELRKMNERELLAAAEFARQKDVLDRMVSTSDRTRSELDFTQRFPSPFRDVMVSTTESLGLDMAWVYGLIRQESRFVQNSRSHVGASGLMQLMPGTAKWVAHRIGMRKYSQHQVTDIDTNIRLGTSYLSMVLQDADGSQAMATAAYNAGPARMRAWRATLTRPVEGAIFAESVPYNETRDYVKKVLSNATYYAALFESKPQSLKARLGTVTPQGSAPSELP